MSNIKHIVITILILLSENLYSSEYVESRIADVIKQVNNPSSVQLNRIRKGSVVRIVWLDIPIYIYHRTERDFELLEKMDGSLLADPSDIYAEESVKNRYGSSVAGVYAQLYKAGTEVVRKNKLRSTNKDFLVISALDPVSSCTLVYDVKDKIRFYDPCTSRAYDATGRLFKISKEGEEVAKPFFNLRVMPSFMKGAKEMFLGSRGGYKALPKVEFDYTQKYITQTPSQQLATAVLYNDLERMLIALKEGADIEYQNGNMPPPLIGAVFGSNSRSINILLEKGAKVTERAIAQAKLHKRHDVLAMFLEKEKTTTKNSE